MTVRATLPEALQPLATPIDNLAPDPQNARRGNVDAIRKSLSVFGQRKPVVVRRTGRDVDGNPTGIVIAGNHTLAAANALGWTHVAAVFVDDDDTTAKAYALADNRTGEIAEWDADQLAATLAELSATDIDMDALGWTDAELGALLGTGSAGDVLADPDDAPALPTAPIAALGDNWQLGPHRLLCGDSTDVAAVEAMLAGERCDTMWTDPPYGVEIVGGSHALSPAERKARGGKTIQNDGAQSLPDLLAGAFAVATAVLKPGAAVYVAHVAGPMSLTFVQAFTDAGWHWRQNLVWVKNSLVLSRSDYHYRHEPILYGFTDGGDGRLGRGGERWYGDNAATTVFEIDKPSRSEDHPTMKPVELIVRMLDNSCPPGGLVYEPFGGSGSTLIAAHLTGRVARVVELDPRYADVTCRRWQKLTGIRPVLAATGEPHDFLAEDT